LVDDCAACRALVAVREVALDAGNDGAGDDVSGVAEGAVPAALGSSGVAMVEKAAPGLWQCLDEAVYSLEIG
jgi:hypothetical protein